MNNMKLCKHGTCTKEAERNSKYCRLHRIQRTDRERVADAFQTLRKRGFSARINFSCCGSCGSYELAHKGKPYVFYHQQNERSFDSHDQIKDELYLHWSNEGHDKTIAQDEFLLAVKVALEEQGLGFEHDGNGGTCIKVLSYRRQEATHNLLEQ